MHLYCSETYLINVCSKYLNNYWYLFSHSYSAEEFDLPLKLPPTYLTWPPSEADRWITSVALYIRQGQVTKYSIQYTWNYVQVGLTKTNIKEHSFFKYFSTKYKWNVLISLPRLKKRTKKLSHLVQASLEQKVHRLSWYFLERIKTSRPPSKVFAIKNDSYRFFSTQYFHTNCKWWVNHIWFTVCTADAGQKDLPKTAHSWFSGQLGQTASSEQSG